MNVIGVIAEYNPLHNGHVYHINKIKEMFPDSIIVLVMSGNFTERGDVSVINKWDKTRVALDYVDLVVELPFVFATQGADVFAHGAVGILNALNVDYLVFGSECDDVDYLKALASIQVNNKKYDLLVKKFMECGFNYPTSMSRALNELSGNSVFLPNDILGVCYIKEIMKLNSSIIPLTIKRTSDYNSLDTSSSVISATAIRRSLHNNDDISSFVPSRVLPYIRNIDINSLFCFLKYKIITEDDLTVYETVDFGINYRIKKYIDRSFSFDELIANVKTKYYTYNRLKRMFLHILCGFTKEENLLCKDIHYIRVLGFNSFGKSYIHNLKKSCSLPIISNFNGINDVMLDIENRSSKIYSFLEEDFSEFEKPVIRQ